MRICVLGGGGNVAEAISSHMAGLNHEVVQFRFSPHIPVKGVPSRPERSRVRLENSQIKVTDPQGAQLVSHRTRWITTAEFHLVDLFVCAFPSYMVEPVGRLLGDKIAGRPLINLSDRFLGSYNLIKSALRHHGPKSGPSHCVAFNGVPIMAQKQARDSPLTVFYFKRAHSIACFPHNSEAVALDLLNASLGIGRNQVRVYESMIHLAFENTHCVEHAVVDLGNLRRGLYSGQKNLYSETLYRPEAVEQINCIVTERDLIAKSVVGRSFASLADYDLRIFGASGSPGASLAGMAQYRIEHVALARAPSPDWWGAFGFEDNGWSMVTMESLAKLFNIETPRLSRLVDSWNHYSGTDYRAVGRTCATLGVRPAAGRAVRDFTDLTWLPGFHK